MPIGVEKSDIDGLHRQGRIRVLPRSVPDVDPQTKPKPDLEVAKTTQPALPPDLRLNEALDRLGVVLEGLSVSPASDQVAIEALRREISILKSHAERKRTFEMIPKYGNFGLIEKIVIKEM